MKKSRISVQIQQLYHVLPYRIAPALAEEAAAAWQKTEGDSWIMHEHYVQEPLAILQFRRDMHEAFNAA
jgi:hypothetical protein